MVQLSRRGMKYLTKINRNFKSFTLGFENKTYDESRFIKNININKDKNIFIANDESLKKTHQVVRLTTDGDLAA